MNVYKTDQSLTEEQGKIVDKIMSLGDDMFDVAKIYMDYCAKQNYTDEFKHYLANGQFEGMGMDEDV